MSDTTRQSKYEVLDSASKYWHNRAVADYDINDLAEQMGTPRRTIRYYVEIGLLPPPEGAGRAAMYGDEHLERLAAIKRLQSQGLTLEQIREALAVESSSALGETRIPHVTARRSTPRMEPSTPQTSASEYLAQVRSRLAPQVHLTPPKPSPGDAYHAEPWTRIRIDADTELHVRRSSTKRIARLVRELRRTLAEDSERAP